MEALDRERAVAVGSENGFLQPDDFHRGPPVIVHTGDGGTRWRRAFMAGVDPDRFKDIQLMSVCLTPMGHGVATGTDIAAFSGSLVLLTHDAGATWTVVTDRVPTAPGMKVACAGDRDLWIAGSNGTLAHSPDGGETWWDAAGALNRPRIALIAITFQDPLEGWIAGDRLVAFHTTDGGQHWSPHEIQGTTGLVDIYGGVDFNGQHGVIVLQDLHPLAPPRSSFGVTFATFDAGQTWVETVLPNGINAIWDVSVAR